MVQVGWPGCRRDVLAGVVGGVVVAAVLVPLGLIRLAVERRAKDDLAEEVVRRQEAQREAVDLMRLAWQTDVVLMHTDATGDPEDWAAWEVDAAALRAAAARGDVAAWERVRAGLDRRRWEMKEQARLRAAAAVLGAAAVTAPPSHSPPGA